MTEYDYSPEAVERYQRKIQGIGKWAQETSRFNGDFGNPFEHTPSALRRRLSSSSSSGSDSDSAVTSISRSRLYPKSLTVWPGRQYSPPRRPPPQPTYVSPPPPALAQRPPPTRSVTVPNPYPQHHSPVVQQVQQATQPYPYPTQQPGPVGYYSVQQPMHVQPQQQYTPPTFMIQPAPPKRSNTTPSKPVIPKGYQYFSTPANSPVPSAYPSPYGSATYGSQPTSPRSSQNKNWLTRVFGALSIRGRSASVAPIPSSNNSYGTEFKALRHARSKSVGHPSDRERDRERDRARERDRLKDHNTRRSRSTRSTRRHHRDRYSDDSDRDNRGHGRHRDRSRERDSHRDHRRARSLYR